MSLVNLNALREQPLSSNPFDHLVVPDFIECQVLERINRDFPTIETAANHDPQELAPGASFARLIDEIRQPGFAQVLGEKFNMSLSDLPTTITVRKFCERTDGNIHTDHKSKIITVLLYFNEQWPHDEGCLRLLRSKTDIDDFAAEVKPIGGTLLAFRRTDHSWHGHKRFVGERRMLQMNYLDRSRVAVIKQRVSRFGTHFMKNVLKMR